MKSFNGKILAVAVFTILLALVLANPVTAILQVEFTVYDADNPTIFYNHVFIDGVAPDADGIANSQIDINSPYLPIPGVSVQGSFHTSKSGGLNLITSGESAVTNDRDNTTRVYVAVSDTDFTAPASIASVTGSGTFTGAQGSTMYMGYYDDPQNEQGANFAFADYADFVANAASLTPGVKISEYTFSAADNLESFEYDVDNIGVSDPTPYSMTLLFDYTLTPGGELVSRGQSMYKSHTPAVPEFPSLALPAGMVIGLLGAVLLIQRTREQ
jgi:hypothetical protein